MNTAAPDPSVCPSPIWDRFVKVLANQGVKQHQLRWYAYRVEQYLQANGGRSVARHDAAVLNRYLSVLGGKKGLTEWQYRQAVEALRLFWLHAVGAPWAQQVDWGYWKDSARGLEARHATVAREAALAGEPGPPQGPPGPLDRIRNRHPELIRALIAEIRRRNYSIRTEQAYEQWVCRFSAHFSGRDPRTLGAGEVKRFLEHLAVDGRVAASTQNQALNALVFLYKQVLGRPLDDLDGFARAKRPRRLPVVLTRTEARALLAAMEGTRWLMASLLYGTGMRLMECVRLRIQDLDFRYRQIMVRNAKGAKDRVVPLPQALRAPLRAHLKVVRALFEADLARGAGVPLPVASTCRHPRRTP